MLVARDRLAGTIGGGHLELRAIEIARAMLALTARARHFERFALGPSLGQCCGGVVHLAFERVDAARRPALLDARRTQDSWRLVALDGAPTAPCSTPPARCSRAPAAPAVRRARAAPT